ncbi:MAG TPA: ABC transporter substrate-binding protein, partial [Anaerolineales bacterium]|nr:ABC transporter substrate-binding protein [Anaerolineales bacterium]
MKSKNIHPLVTDAQEQLRKGLISRRDFLRISTLLGMSVASASILAACGGDENAAVINNVVNNNVAAANNNNAVNNNAAADDNAADDDEPEVMNVTRGGTLRAAARIESVDHPARFNLVSQSNPWRQVFEYLTYMDADGIAYPYLLDKWEVSEDLLTWILTLKQGIKFSDGRDFTAEDVIFNFGQWLNDAESSMKGAMSYIDPNGIEKQDEYSVIVHLQSPSIFLPEHLFSYPAMIVPDGFGGDMVAEPVGTGPFTMEEYVPGDRCVLKARSDYWQTDGSGESLPYLDEIVFVQTDGATALQGGEVDFIAEPNVTEYDALKDGGFTVVATPSASTRVLRMRVDQEPWTNNDVRMALKMCHDREKILSAAIMGQG